ncbi:UNVERIFIED_ORG: hypothetical protein B2H93_13470 [Clostridium botulinum]
MTPYSNIIKRFERKIKKDKEYFCYSNITEDELIKIISKRSKELLIDSLDEFILQISIQQKKNVNFENRDDELEEFNFKLSASEEDIISDLMVVKYFDEELIKLKAMQKYLGDGIKVFSPNAERKTFLEMVDYKHKQFDKKMSNYNSINRETGEYLLAY